MNDVKSINVDSHLSESVVVSLCVVCFYLYDVEIRRRNMFVKFMRT